MPSPMAPTKPKNIKKISALAAWIKMHRIDLMALFLNPVVASQNFSTLVKESEQRKW